MTRSVTLTATEDPANSDVLSIPKGAKYSYAATLADEFDGSVDVQGSVTGGQTWDKIATLTTDTATVTSLAVGQDMMVRASYNAARSEPNTGTLTVVITEVLSDTRIQTDDDLRTQAIAQDVLAVHEAEACPTAHPNTGWKDITTDLSRASTGAASPTLTEFRTGIYAYAFSATVDEELFAVFHIPHDIKPNSKVYPHIHYSNGASTNTTQDILWKFSYTFAKGFASPAEAFGDPATITLSSKGSEVQYAHLITECTDDEAITIEEPDGLLIARIWRDADDPADTYPDVAFAFTADLHYQSDRESTPNKRPDFYAE